MAFYSKIRAIAAVGALATLQSCDPPTSPAKNQSGPIAASGVTIRPLAVTEGPRRRLAGRFTVTVPVRGEPSIDSNRTGGACLIAQINHLAPKACNADSECALDVVIPASGQGANRTLTRRDRWYGYCVREVGRPSSERGQCWIRPGEREKLCVFRQTASNPWPLGTHPVPASGTIDTSDLYLYLGAANASLVQGVKWRVHGCMNPRDPGNPARDAATCGTEPGPPPLKRDGPTTVVR